MLSTSGLFVFALGVGLCLGGPTKSLDSAPAAENEVGAQRSPVTTNEEIPIPSVKNHETPGLIHSPVKDPPHFIIAEPENDFGIASGYAEGNFHNEEFGYAGKGAATGIAGGLINDKGLTGGGAGYAAGIAGVDTKPFKGFLSLNSNSQATFNTYGEKAVPFSKEEPVAEDEVKVEDAPVAAPSMVNKPTAVSGAAPAVDKNSEADTATGEKSPTIPTLPTVAGAINNFFKPILPLSPPSLLHTLTGGILSPKPLFEDKAEVKDEESEGAAAASVESEEGGGGGGGGFYNFIRPLTPSGIASSVSSMLKPLTTLSGQAQGSITLTGGASITGSTPAPPVKPSKPKPSPPSKPPCHVDHKPDCHVDHKPPCHVEHKPPCHVEHKPDCHDHGCQKPCQKPCAHDDHKPHQHHDDDHKPHQHHDDDHKPHQHHDDDHKPHQHQDDDHKPHQHQDDDKLSECKALCRKNDKAGGSILGGCCTCLCPAPEVPHGHLCCTGTDQACDAHCKRNSFHKYAGGSCNLKTHNCDCKCNPWEPFWVRVGPSYTHHHEHTVQTEGVKKVEEKVVEEEKKA